MEKCCMIQDDLIKKQHVPVVHKVLPSFRQIKKPCDNQLFIWSSKFCQRLLSVKCLGFIWCETQQPLTLSHVMKPWTADAVTWGTTAWQTQKHTRPKIRSSFVEISQTVPKTSQGQKHNRTHTDTKTRSANPRVIRHTLDYSRLQR